MNAERWSMVGSTFHLRREPPAVMRGHVVDDPRQGSRKVHAGRITAATDWYGDGQPVRRVVNPGPRSGACRFRPVSPRFRARRPSLRFRISLPARLCGRSRPCWERQQRVHQSHLVELAVRLAFRSPRQPSVGRESERLSTEPERPNRAVVRPRLGRHPGARTRARMAAATPPAAGWHAPERMLRSMREFG